MATRNIIRVLVTLVCILGTVLGLANTYGDNEQARALAQQAACGSPSCAVTLLRESRSAFSQGFTFQTALLEKGQSGKNESVDVLCKRRQILIGEYECALAPAAP